MKSFNNLKITYKVGIRVKIYLSLLLSFIAILFFVWINEYFDICHLVFNTKSTPFNWAETLLESIFIILIAFQSIFIVKKLFSKIEYLEGFIVVCSSCKKVRLKDDEWIQLDQFLQNNSLLDLSHSICPECIKKLYPELNINNL